MRPMEATKHKTEAEAQRKPAGSEDQLIIIVRLQKTVMIIIIIIRVIEIIAVLLVIHTYHGKNVKQPPDPLSIRVL